MAGNHVVAVDGRELPGFDNPCRLLQHLGSPFAQAVAGAASFEVAAVGVAVTLAPPTWRA